MIVEEIEMPPKSPTGGEMPKFYQLNREREQDIVPFSHWQAGTERPSFWVRAGLVIRAFWHSLSPRQLRRHFSWASLNVLMGRYVFWLGTAGLLGYYAYREQFFFGANDGHSTNVSTVATASLVSLPAAADTATLAVSTAAAVPSAQAAPAVAAATVPVVSADGVSEDGKALLSALDKVDAATQSAFLQRFGKVAQDEMRKFDVPASITLALAIAYSQFGTSDLSVQHHNFFAIACHEATGSQAAGERCFAQYENAWASFRAHSQLLQADAYKELREVAKGDYWVWALGLERIGYRGAGESFSAELLKLIIERYDLAQYDKLG